MTTSSARPGAPGASQTGILSVGPFRYGYTAAVAERFAAHPAPGGAGPGRVIRVDRNRVLVAARNETLHLPYPRAAEVPATGDWVWLGANSAGEPAIVAVLPRYSELSRKRAFEASSESQSASGLPSTRDNAGPQSRLHQALKSENSAKGRAQPHTEQWPSQQCEQ